MGLSLSHVGLSSKQGFGWGWVPAHGFKTQSVVNSFSWAAITKYHRLRDLKTGINFLTILDSILKSRDETLLMWASLVAQMVKRLPAMRETQVRFLGREDPLEKEMAIHSSTLAGKSHGRRSLIGYSLWGHKELDTTEWLHFNYFADKGPSSQSYDFSSSHLWMWKLDQKESWALKNWCFWTVVLEKTLKSPLDCRESQPVNPKGNQSWMFIGSTDAEAETPVLWPPDVKNWLIRKDPDAGKDWWQEEKGLTEDEMVRWHHWLNGCEFEQALAIGDRQGSLAWWNPWGCKELDTTERLNWTELNWTELFERLKVKMKVWARVDVWRCLFSLSYRWPQTQCLHTAFPLRSHRERKISGVSSFSYKDAKPIETSLHSYDLTSEVVPVIKTRLAMQEIQETWVQSLGQEDPWRWKWQPTPVFLPGKSYEQISWAIVLGVAKSWTRLKCLNTQPLLLLCTSCTSNTEIRALRWILVGGIQFSL